MALPLLLGTLFGALARLSMLRVDYRQYPSYPQGFVIHLSLGTLGAFLGTAGPLALARGDFTAASFLALAATQFREVRDTERRTLQALEATEMIPRGTGYIEGIARVFEARNYLAMGVGLLFSLGYLAGLALGVAVWPGAAAAQAALVTGGAVALAGWVLLERYTTGPRLESLAEARPAEIRFEGPVLTVSGVAIMNVGWGPSRERFLKEGLAAEIRPRNLAAKATLANLGQRQAIAHDVAALVGFQHDVDQPEFTPLVRRKPDGALVLAVLPAERSMEALLLAIRQVPVLEGSVRKPLQSPVGRLLEGETPE
ncbi:YIEGIA domain-containing protein [Limnochorda pilosa]|uniref:Membrane protein n=1 Tax=Limnochorda pilosa TaxID=1555112 RepID=A0A0K2SKI4_LIMPI|nr:YIEGIA domain-containing protein [Limnochorda pilosa]BAS27623.1 membrane protein [Limnochorda pilosa]